MRLLELKSQDEFSLTKKFIKDIPPYAILSHTWGKDEDEVDFSDLENRTGKTKAGYDKLRFCGKQARSDKIQYFWVDTCCINKSDYTELAEALNSMFRWYRDAAKCYVYLSDVSTNDHNLNDLSVQSWEPLFRNSRWFTRGWTLQELIAPPSVEFFCLRGTLLGDKKSLEQKVHEITGIPVRALQGCPLSEFSSDERMSWAERRETTREEDKAYSLLGIFDLHMSFFYGEGKDGALRRLRKKIDKQQKAEKEAPRRGSEGYNKLAPPVNDIEMSHFQGRSDICSELEETFFRTGLGNSYNLYVLHGRPGTGKTTIANRHWTLHRDKYWVVWSIDGTNETSIWLSFCELARRIISQKEGDDDLQQLAQDNDSQTATKIIKNWLQEQRRHWLLIFDAADNIQVDYQGYFPASRFGSIIVTTQKFRIFKADCGSFNSEVSNLSPEESSNLLWMVINDKGLRDPDIETELQNVVETLGYLPLGIRLAGRAIASKDSEDSFYSIDPLKKILARYVEDIKNVSGAHVKGMLKEIWVPYQKLMQTLKWEFDTKGDLKGATDCQHLLYFLSFLSHRDIPMKLFDALLAESAADALENSPLNFRPSRYTFGSMEEHHEFLLPFLQPDVEVGKRRRRIYTAIAALADWGLITSNRDTRQLFLHPLIQACARESVADELIYEKLAVFTICQSIRINPDAESRSFHRSLLPHLEAREQSLANEQRIFKLFRPSTTLAAEMVLRISMVYFESGLLQIAYQKQRCVVDEKQGQDSGSLLRAKTLMATSLHDLNGSGQRKEALQLREEIHEAFQKLSEESVEYLDSLSALADSLDVSHGNGDRAVLYRRQVYESWRKRSPISFDTIEAQRRLARSLYLTGQRNEALEIRSKICKTFANLPFPAPQWESLDEFSLGDLRDLAQSLSDKGYWKRALEMRTAVVDGYKRILSDSHYDTILAKHDLASSYMQMHRFDEAIALSLEIFEHYSEIFEFNHPFTINSYLDLARQWKKKGHIMEKAQQMEQEALDVWNQLSNKQQEEHIEDILKCKASLAQSKEKVARRRLGTKVGRDNFKSALQLRKEIYHEQVHLKKEDTNLDVLLAHNDVANCYFTFGELHAAYSVRMAVLSVFEAQNIDDIRDIPKLDPLSMKAYCEVQKGLARDCERIAEEFAPLTDPERQNLPFSARDGSAKTPATASAASSDSDGSIGDADTQDGDDHTGEHAAERQKYEETARKAWRRIYRLRSSLTGAELDHLTLMSMIDLGRCLGQQEANKDEAIRLYERALEVMKQNDRLGAPHPHVAKFQEELNSLNKCSTIESWLDEVPIIPDADSGTHVSED